MGIRKLRRSSSAAKQAADFQRRIARALTRRDGGTDAALLALVPELESAGLPNEAAAVRALVSAGRKPTAEDGFAALVSRVPLHVKRHT